MSGISTHGQQRLQWQYDEQTAGIYAEPSLAEELEARDEEFRHWDQHTFASAATKPLGYVRIPLWRKDGSIGAYALVDEADAIELDRQADLARTAPGARGKGPYRWHVSPKGYACRPGLYGEGKRNVRILMHRQLLGFENWDRERSCDHINGDKLDNRRANLRIVSQAENTRNMGSRGGTSKYRGVSLRPSGRWYASASYESKSYALGTFDTEEEAAAAVGTFWRERGDYPRDTITDFAHEAASAATGTWDVRERGAATSSSDDGGAPTNREALASGPLESQGLAPSSSGSWSNETRSTNQDAPLATMAPGPTAGTGETPGGESGVPADPGKNWQDWLWAA